MVKKKIGKILALSRKNAGKTGLALASAAAIAGVGYYFFYQSKKGARFRKKATAWSGQLKREVVERGHNLRNLNQRNISAMIGNVARAYTAVSTIDRPELTHAIRELRHNWNEIKREIESKVKKKATKK